MDVTSDDQHTVARRVCQVGFQRLTATIVNEFVTSVEAVLTEAISCIESIESKMSREFMTDLRGRADLARLEP